MFLKNNSLISGYITFPPTNKKEIIFRSSYYSNGKTSSPMLDENYSTLINFLNYNVSDLNENLEKLYQSLLSDSENETTTYLKLVSTQLIEWHPFFEHHTIYYICDLLISLTAYNLAYMDLKNNFEDFKTISSENIFHFCLTKIIEAICNKITTDDCHSNNDYFIKELTDYFKNVYDLTSPYPLYWNPINTPLGYIEKFREYLAEYIPQIRYDSNPNLWDNFFNEIKCLYGAPTLLKNFTLDPFPEEALLYGEKSLPPKDFYYISTFPQYIFAQIETVKQNKSIFSLCQNCGTFYLQHKNLKKHKCPTGDYYENMKLIKSKTYKKHYSRAETLLNTPNANHFNAKTAIDVLRNSGFLDFHNKVYNFAIRHHISTEIYSSYTNDDKYTFNNFFELKPIYKYIPDSKEK